MMDNRAADVPGSGPLITVPGEASDWSPAHPSRPGVSVSISDRGDADVTEQLEPHRDPRFSPPVTFLIR